MEKPEPGAPWFIAPITARRVGDIVVGQLHGDAGNDSLDDAPPFVKLLDAI
jgi:hypothetical protein